MCSFSFSDTKVKGETLTHHWDWQLVCCDSDSSVPANCPRLKDVTGVVLQVQTWFPATWFWKKSQQCTTMSVNESGLTLLSTHDLTLKCPQCCNKEREITYSLKSVQHQCAHTLLLCRAKGGSKWRPVDRRPTLIYPKQYEVCYFFKEGNGCTKHRNRCTFARSAEEAAVWNFEKKHRLDHDFLCDLMKQFDNSCDPPDTEKPPSSILDTLELSVACNFCLVKERETTCTIRSVKHYCHRDLLLVKTRDSVTYRPVSNRPTQQFSSRVQYQKCFYFVEGFGCNKHGENCTFARSHEEAAIWNYMRDNNIDKRELIRHVKEEKTKLETPKYRAESILKRFPGTFLELCKDCFHSKPQRLTSQRCTTHRWDPILVHRLSEKDDKQIYQEIHPLPHNCLFDYCSHVLQGKSCWHQPGSCMSAQSQVEMAVWRAEHSGHSIRPLLLQSSRSEPTKSPLTLTYCKVCQLEVTPPESFNLHCSSMEHALMLSADTAVQWTGRPPPHNRRADFLMCQR